MASKKSNGLANKLLDSTGNSFNNLFTLGFIRILTGTPPTLASDAETGTLLCIVSNNSTGTGLTFNTPAVAGVLSKKTSETWSGTNLASGTATYFRFVPATNTTGSSSTECRLQGTIGTGGAVDMILSDPVFVSAATFTLPTYTESITVG